MKKLKKILKEMYLGIKISNEIYLSGKGGMWGKW